MNFTSTEISEKSFPCVVEIFGRRRITENKLEISNLILLFPISSLANKILLFILYTQNCSDKLNKKYKKEAIHITFHV